ncbi:MAG: hypothetical protein AAFY17_14820, partial [Cyanobacteria bacterium J06642_11]
ASRLTNDTYTTVQAEAEAMDKTAQSILELRSTVGDTAKKIKRLGESAQKISQAVSLIDSISLTILRTELGAKDALFTKSWVVGMRFNQSLVQV